MSRYPSIDHGAAPLPPERENVPTRGIVLVASVTLAVFVASVLLVFAWMGWEERQLLPKGPATAPTELSKEKIGIVEQRLFSLARRGQEQRSQQLERLQTYGWVDREKGIIHIPIERAMEQVIEESRR